MGSSKAALALQRYTTDKGLHVWTESVIKLMTTQGEAEKRLFEVSKANDSFDVVVLRPGGVVADGSIVANVSSSYVVDLSHLSGGLVNACVRPPTDKIVENADIIKMTSI